MKVWRAGLSASSISQRGFIRAFDFTLRCAAPVGLLLVCLFVAGEVVQSQNVIWQTVAARRIETEALDTFLHVHTIKSRRLEYLLTGSDHYLTRTVQDQARALASFENLQRELARDPVRAAQLNVFRAHAQRLLDFTGRLAEEYRAGHLDKVRAILSSDEFVRVMDDTEIGGKILIESERQHIVTLQRERTAAFNQTLFGILVLISGLAAYSAARIAILSSSMRRQKLTVHTLERAREAAEEARIAAEDASRAKSEFLASVSHELRTPLNAILGFSELINLEPLGPLGHPRYGEYAVDIHKSGRHLLALVNDILDLTKLGAGKMELRESEFSVADLVSDCLSLLGGEAARHLTLKSEIAPDLPRLHADFQRIKQILLNLLSNAAKFTPEGGQVTVTAAWRQGVGLHIAVADTGIGMSPKDIDKALSPFGQIDSKIARRHHGVGLGLPIARAYAELHGGHLTVESTEGQGTTITLILPESRVAVPLRATG